MKRRRLLIAAGLTIVLCVSGSIILFMHTHKPPSHSVLPTTITSKISFIVYLPVQTWVIDTAHATYNMGVLGFTAIRGDTTLSITEQATPEVFNDVAEYYPTLLDRLHSYASLGTANGIAHLTKPAELNGSQQAVLNNNGTLLFVHPSKAISTDDWRRFFNSLQVVKPR